MEDGQAHATDLDGRDVPLNWFWEQWRIQTTGNTTLVQDESVSSAAISILGDVLYLNIGEPKPQAHGLETPEGHAIHYDEKWVIIGMTLLNVRWTLEREGELALTWPAEHVAADTLGPVLAAA